MLTDIELLRSYAHHGSETAFGELVGRHVNLVYSTAMRVVGGDEHRARDVAQSVFTDLARKAASLCSRAAESTSSEKATSFSLSGWLYTSARFAAANSVRAEQTRHKHEEKAQAMTQILQSGSSEPDWAELRPVLDDAMGMLGQADRDALLFRFFDGKDLRTVGNALGLSEDAARMRISRALDKLREVLANRGVTTTAGALSVTLATHAVETAPVGLAAALTSASFSAVAATSSTSTIALLRLMASIKSKLALTALLALGVAAPVIIQRHSLSQLRSENDILRAQLAAIQIPTSNAPPSDPLETSRLNSQESELLRLRGEVTRLRADAARPRQPPAPAQGRTPPRSGRVDTIGGFELFNGSLLSARHVDTVKTMKLVGLALTRLEKDPAIPAEVRTMPFSEDNQLRKELKQSISLPEEEWDQFEIIVPNLDTLTQHKSDPGLIVARSKEPIQTTDGRWVRVYTRADGSVLNLIHDSPTKVLDFGELENSVRSNPP